MIKELSRDLVTLIQKDYPDLEELNLSSNGKRERVFVTGLTLVLVKLLQRSRSSRTSTCSASRSKASTWAATRLGRLLVLLRSPCASRRVVALLLSAYHALST